MLTLVIGAAELTAVLLRKPPPVALWSRVALAGGPAGLVACGLLIVSALIPGFWRIADKPPAPYTVALLPASGRSTAILSCLAYLGSHVRRFVVLDTDCQAQFDRLMGHNQQESAAESLTLRHSDGRITRLLEIPSLAALPDSEVARLCRNLDEFVVVETRASAQEATGLRNRLRSVAGGSASVRSLHLERNRTVHRRRSTEPDLQDVLAAYRSGAISDTRCAEIVDRLWAGVGSASGPEKRPESVRCVLD